MNTPSGSMKVVDNRFHQTSQKGPDRYDVFGGELRSERSSNVKDLNPTYLHSLGITGPINNKIFISNLDCKVTEPKLKEIFQIAGKLAKVKLNTNYQGISLGYGTAEYEHPLEAVQAISLFNGHCLYSKIMNVRMDKSEKDDFLPTKLPSGLESIGEGLGINGQMIHFSSSEVVNSSNKGTLSSTSNSVAAERMMSASALDIGTSAMNTSLPSQVGLGIGELSSLMSSNRILEHSDSVNWDGLYPLGSDMPKSFQDESDRHNSLRRTDTVLLGNLPSSFSWPVLKERFREIDVSVSKFVYLGQEKALIRFVSVQDAQRAVHLINSFRIDEKVVQICFI